MTGRCSFPGGITSTSPFTRVSAFELKALLGITLFASYITDIFYGADPHASKFVCIFVTVLGLFFIAKSKKKGDTNYHKILVPLVLYLAAKYGYGLVIKAFSPYISSTMQLLPALILLPIILTPKAVPQKLLKKIPAAFGLLYLHVSQTLQECYWKML